MSEYSKLPWNQDIFSKLVQLENTQQLGHAYLVQGQKGVGKDSLVKDFSACLLCADSQGKAACGECDPCLLFAAGTHPDFKYIALEEAASQIKIEQVRNSKDFLANTPLMGKYKILVIHSAEKMNVNAANALLKNLEEPASNTLLFLLSHQPGLLMPTIRSRCQQIKLPSPNEEQALQWLQKHISADQAKLCLELASGAPLQALSFADEERQHERREIQKRLLELLRSEIVTSDAARLLGEHQIEDVLNTLMLSMQQLSRYLHTHNTAGEALPVATEIQDIANILTIRRIRPLHKFNSLLIQARIAIQSTANPNAQLLLESLCYKWVELMREQAHTEVLAV